MRRSSRRKIFSYILYVGRVHARPTDYARSGFARFRLCPLKLLLEMLEYMTCIRHVSNTHVMLYENIDTKHYIIYYNMLYYYNARWCRFSWDKEKKTEVPHIIISFFELFKLLAIKR